MGSIYKQFKSDCESMELFDFMNKWEKHPKYEEYNQKKYDEDFYRYVCEEYNYDEEGKRKFQTKLYP